jgi:hypothetical protein
MKEIEKAALSIRGQVSGDQICNFMNDKNKLTVFYRSELWIKMILNDNKYN